MMKFRNGKLFGGVYCADNLPKKPKVNYGYIVNTDNCASSGTHWVAFYFPSNQMPEYFDSNGFPPMNFRFLDFLGYQKHFFFLKFSTSIQRKLLLRIFLYLLFM